MHLRTDSCIGSGIGRLRTRLTIPEVAAAPGLLFRDISASIGPIRMGVTLEGVRMVVFSLDDTQKPVSRLKH